MDRAEVEKLVSLKRSAIYAAMSAGRFPRPYQLGPRCVRWRESEIESWMSSRPRSNGDRDVSRRAPQA